MIEIYLRLFSVVSSIQWDDIHFEKPFWSMKAYSHSKLANILFTNELARRLQDTNITANSLHPGKIGFGFLFS